MERSKNHNKTRNLVQVAVLISMLLVLEITNIGYIKFGVLEMTIMQVPVIIGAITMGPTTGAFLGGVFGLTSFWQCFGKSPFGAALLGINPLYTFLVCVIPRILMGLLCGLIFKWLQKIDKKNIMSYFGASLAAALINTILFMGMLIALFGNTDYIVTMQKAMGTVSILGFVVAFVGIQGLVEAGLCSVLGTGISKSMGRIPKN